MPRVPRRLQVVRGTYYHLMNRGHNREVLFRDDEDYRHFLQLLAHYHGRFAQRLYHYCLMPNHFHLLADCETPKGLSAWMAGLLRSYVHYYHRRYGFVRHLFQGRFKSPAVGVESYFLNCARYIERNSVRAHLAALPWEYAWSSSRAYVLGAEDLLLAYNVWYRDLGTTAAQRQGRWREFLLGDDPQEAVVQRGDWVEANAAQRRRLQREGARPAR